ncbi:MAG: DUF4397 domain-containing protein [Gemmatimonadetes bacterium]|nr:DUF4397 domain-containing protein [Gemmatimonadota bacterium]
MSTKSALRVLLVSLAALGLAGCGDDDPTGPAAGSSAVRVGHLSPDAPAVDVWVDGSVALSGLTFREFSDYVDLSAGSHRVQVTPTGASTPIVIDATLTLEDGKSYTVAATGLLASIAATVLEDERSGSGDASVRFVHGSPDAPAVDVTLTDGTVLFGAVPFGDSETISVPAGAYDLQVRAAGTSTVVLSFADVALAGATNYTVWAVGQLGDGSLDALVTLESEGTGSAAIDLPAAEAEVRFAHLSPDAPNVDIVVDGDGVASDVPYLAVSDYLNLPARTSSVQIFATGDTMNPVIDATVTLLPDGAYTIAATGLVADLQPLVLEDSRTGPNGSQTWVRFVHTSPDAPAVDVQVAAGPTLFSDVEFRQADGYLTVDSGTYDLEVRLSSNDALALEVPNVALVAGENLTVFAVGLAGNSTLAALAAVDAP